MKKCIIFILFKKLLYWSVPISLLSLLVMSGCTVISSGEERLATITSDVDLNLPIIQNDEDDEAVPQPTDSVTPSGGTSEAPPPSSPEAPVATLSPENLPPVVERPALPKQSPAAGDNPQIEVANGSGVSGYTVALFGSGFGYPQGNGTVTILDQPADVIEWTDSYIQVVVPAASPGRGNLALVTDAGMAADWPFELYEIDPQFLTPPETRFINIAYQLPTYLQNLESEFCFEQPNNDEMPATQFLTDFRCGFVNVTNVGDAKFRADASLGNTAIIAFNVAQEMVGVHYFQFFADSSWYSVKPGDAFSSYPYNYTLEISNNSSDGIGGDWVVVETVTENVKGTALHKLDIPAGGYTWFRMQVTDGVDDTTEEAGKDFKMKEVRLYRPIGEGGRLDSFAIYGDSITADAFETTGFHGLSNRLKAARQDGYDLIHSTIGLSGQNSGGFLAEETDFDIYDALDSYGYTESSDYWGIAIGTNDAGGGEADIGVEWSNLEMYDERLDAIVQELIARGKVPIIARIPDTDEAQGGFGDIVSKRKVLADVDRIAAEYRLIPGPDLYTEFRRNIIFHESDYIREGDGTHHSSLGIPVLIHMWSETLERIPMVGDE